METTSLPNGLAVSQGSSSIARWFDRLADSQCLSFALFVLLAAGLRAANLGDWNYEVDDQFFSLVGHRIDAGDILYVDIFDRKGPALYFLFAILAVFGKSVIPYQLFGTLCVALAAYGVYRIATLLAGSRGALVAGCMYCLLMTAFGGANGQTPVFYNPLMVACAWAIVTRLDLLARGHIDRRIAAGFACAGLAVAFKMSAAIEGAFFGIFAASLLAGAPVSLDHKFRQVLLLALLGLLPTIVAGTLFAAAGHFEAFWQAVFASNLDRSYPDAANRLWRIKLFASKILPLITFGLFSLLSLSRQRELKLSTGFVALWAIAAIGAILVFPTFYTHYILPVLPPLCILGAGAFRHYRSGLPMALLIGVAFVWLSGEVDFSERSRSRTESAALVSYVRQQTPDHDLLVWGFPTYLYVLADAKPPSRLAFPPHFFDAYESGSSGINEVDELKLVLSRKPATVVTQRPLPAFPLNSGTVPLMERYLTTCARKKSFTTRDHLAEQTQVVYSDCGSH